MRPPMSWWHIYRCYYVSGRVLVSSWPQSRAKWTIKKECDHSVAIATARSVLGVDDDHVSVTIKRAHLNKHAHNHKEHPANVSWVILWYLNRFLFQTTLFFLLFYIYRHTCSSIHILNFPEDDDEEQRRKRKYFIKIIIWVSRNDDNKLSSK